MMSARLYRKSIYRLCVYTYVHARVVLIHPPAVGMVMVLFCYYLPLVLVQHLVHQQGRLNSKRQQKFEMSPVLHNENKSTKELKKSELFVNFYLFSI